MGAAVINQASIRSIRPHTTQFAVGTRLHAALRVDEDLNDRLVEAGFQEPFEEGQSVLPPAHFGRVSSFNAKGDVKIHRDQPKETIYRPVEWTHEQWHGQSTVTVTEIIERRYERFPRTQIEPPSVELTLSRNAEGELFITAPARVLGQDDEELLHDVNLLLEVAQRCEILREDLIAVLPRQIRRLNWEVLPPGNYPWDQLRPRVQRMLDGLDDNSRPVVEHRLERVAAYPHDFVAVGRAGFNGYVVFGFPAAAVYVLECTHEGNATYFFGDDWQELSQRTKAEVLAEGAHLQRLIHTRNWSHQLAEALRLRGVRRR